MKVLIVDEFDKKASFMGNLRESARKLRNLYG